jgi:hypothetical protein
MEDRMTPANTIVFMVQYKPNRYAPGSEHDWWRPYTKLEDHFEIAADLLPCKRETGFHGFLNIGDAVRAIEILQRKIPSYAFRIVKFDGFSVVPVN